MAEEAVKAEGRPLLEVSSVETFYGPIQVLMGISLQVRKGEIVTLLGANGAGKSTLLKTVAGLLPDQPDKGTIRFGGQAIERRTTASIISRGIAYVPEGREVFPELSVRDNLTMGAFLRRDRAAVRRDMDRVLTIFPKLAERLTQDAGTMSGGEQQMLAIGRGLMAGPELLMLDEPSLGLAPILVKEIFEVIRRLHADGTTILLVEQNVRMALTVADRGYVMENGRLVMDDTAANLLGNENIQEFYMGLGHASEAAGRQKRYKRKKRWR